MPSNTPSRRAGLALVIATAILAGCGGASQGDSSPKRPGADVQWLGQARPIPGLTQRTVGHGARAAVLLWRKSDAAPRETVVFLHGWLPLPPSSYGDWLRHLADQGNTVIYPVIQDLDTKPEAFRADALAGIAAGLRAVDSNPDTVVAIGHTTGGALAFDYAALAPARGLPGPRAALAVYPGRNPGNGEVTPADLSRIPARTWLGVIAGPGDPIPGGNAQARALLRGARQVPPSRRIYWRAKPSRPGLPPPARVVTRRSFWPLADRLIARARTQVERSAGRR